ncbi:hypothetical protein PISMIDRAFT_689556 [Pisolithus microcarpus 441]|uniref:Uncharacterized protein n=1 Tax=Pisolithus microcarpus 441 TaxID=765257 RepID=A0A0C9XJ39_9AGAM|nr:hypothetical protein BKA83DRAFT_689556 [Pisolithus microcarpus]KIK12340.1 hypothetical protein PISMIDRAFT_689556 [Pisolithus microcarpus 441]
MKLSQCHSSANGNALRGVAPRMFLTLLPAVIFALFCDCVSAYPTGSNSERYSPLTTFHSL